MSVPIMYIPEYAMDGSGYPCKLLPNPCAESLSNSPVKVHPLSFSKSSKKIDSVMVR